MSVWAGPRTGPLENSQTEFDALPARGPERGELLRRECLYHSHIEDWKRQRDAGSLAPGAEKEKNAKDPAAEEIARLRAENKKLQAKNDKLARDLGKTKTALDIAGKAFALLGEISDSADSAGN